MLATKIIETPKGRVKWGKKKFSSLKVNWRNLFKKEGGSFSSYLLFFNWSFSKNLSLDQKKRIKIALLKADCGPGQDIPTISVKLFSG